MRLTLAELDATPEGWAEELAAALAGYDAAAQVIQKREARKGGRVPSGDPGAQPVYGMRGRTFTPEGGFR